LSNIFELCQWLVSTKKYTFYQLVYGFVVLVLILLVYTAITERLFSVINIVKIKLRNKTEYEFPIDALPLYIEREIMAKLSINRFTCR